jgi:hypothetical protein
VSIFAARRADGRAEWRVVADLAANLQPGDVIPHERLLAALDRDDMGPVYQAVARANRHLRRTRSRMLGVVPGKGYRMLSAAEHIPEADRQRARSLRRMETAADVARYTRRDELDAAQTTRLDMMTVALASMAQAIRHLDYRQRLTEAALTNITRRVESLEQQTGGTP